ncbi:MAG: hypothetical protein KAS32_07075 [Candidatus Peribacteraceae bacterium]|nr:hypothetical protein [Candidatus Peribacteraceae bacterium]
METGHVSKSYIDTRVGGLVQGAKDKHKEMNTKDGWIQKFIAGKVGQSANANKDIIDNRR